MSKYDATTDERVYRLCLLGLTDAQIAHAIGIVLSNLTLWKDDHPSLFAAMERGKQEADAIVVESLYKRATGYSHPDVHISNHKGQVIVTETTTHYPPDVKACMFWLKNRQYENWKDIQRTELTGQGGGPIQLRAGKVDLTDFSDEELGLMEIMGMKLLAQHEASENNGKLIGGHRQH